MINKKTKRHFIYNRYKLITVISVIVFLCQFRSLVCFKRAFAEIKDNSIFIRMIKTLKQDHCYNYVFISLKEYHSREFKNGS